MPAIKTLNISKLRNLSSVNLQPSSGINIFYGANGSGKTSLLEAIHLLGRGKTFRSTSKSPIIQDGADSCAVHAALDEGIQLGYSRSKTGEQKINVGGTSASSSAELAQRLPLQLINADTFTILEGGPRARRSFLDWGVFHVEHGFLQCWRQAQKALVNRNNLLKKKGLDQAELEPWSHELSKQAELIDLSRSTYLKAFLESLNTILEELMPLEGLSLVYERGWDKEQSLQGALASSLQKDMKYGFTSAGPHRADLKIQQGKVQAVELLSRGQQKMLVIAMKLAQAALLKKGAKKSCVFLLDDLPAELDGANREKVLNLLAGLDQQAFITGIEKTQLILPLENHKEMQLFHVEHGNISAEN